MNFEKVTAYLECLEKDWGIPACDLSIHLHGEEVYRHICGYRDAKKTHRASREDVYWLYSSSKLFTCTAALQLVERGVVGLEDPVSKYLPYFKDLPVQTPDGPKVPKREATVRDLFTMRSGLTYDLQNPWVLKTIRESGGTASTQELLRALTARGLIFEPGEHFLYSLSHDVLGGVIEIASGKKLSEYFSENIFEPLSMSSFTFHPAEADFEKMQDQYSYGPLKKEAIFYGKRYNMYVLGENYESGGAGLVGGVDDYLKLADALCNFGELRGVRILRPETVDLMRCNQMSGASLEDFHKMRYEYGYGLGVRVMTEAQYGIPVGEFGWDSAAGAWVTISPELGLTAFYAQHVIECPDVYRVIHPTLRNLIYEAAKECD